MAEIETSGKETVTVISNAFPSELFDEWDEDCRKIHGDCRWMKMWFDHMVAKKIPDLEARIEELEKKIGEK